MNLFHRKEKARSRKRRLLRLPEYTLGEEITNAVTHGLGALLALCALLAMIFSGPKTTLAATSLSVYGVSMFLLFLYPACIMRWQSTGPKRFFRCWITARYMY